MKPQLSKLYFHMCKRRWQNKYLPSGPNCPPASLCNAGGRGRTSPPALSGVDTRITKNAENNPKLLLGLDLVSNFQLFELGFVLL